MEWRRCERNYFKYKISKMSFRKFSSKISSVVGSPYTFVLAISTVILWAMSGPMFEYSNTWQLAINTGTTIITFLMVFLIQNTQNRDTKAVHLKLDELIKAIKGARNNMVDIENLSDEELDRFQTEFKLVHEKAQQQIDRIQSVKLKKKNK